MKRSKILASEGERESKINIAHGFKRSQILQGEGAAAQVLQEARSICESLDNIADSLGREGKGHGALQLKLNEEYIATLNEILDKSKVVMLP